METAVLSLLEYQLRLTTVKIILQPLTIENDVESVAIPAVAFNYDSHPTSATEYFIGVKGGGTMIWARS